MAERLDEFELKLKEVLVVKANTELTEEARDEQEAYLWKVINKIWKGMGPIESKYAEEAMDRLFPWDKSKEEIAPNPAG